MNKGRILYIDAIKAVLMFLVIWGHVIQYTNTHEGLNNSIAAFIYSFHMPIFMMVSGMFFQRQLELNIPELIRKNFIRLLLPALFVNLSLFLIIFVNKPRGVIESVNWLWSSRPWFITTLFFCIVTTCIMHKVFKHSGLTFLLTFVLFCLIPSINDRLIFMYPFFILGYAVYNYVVYSNLRGLVWALSTLIFASCIVFELNTADTTIYVTPYTFWNVDSCELHLDSTLWIAFKRYFIGCCGSLCVFFILKNLFCGIAEPFCRLNIVCFIGRNTLGLYLLQICIFTIWMGFRNETLSNLTYGRDWLAFILSLILLGVLCFCIFIMRKSKILKMLVLGEK